jgi:hypothetical protein
MELVALAAVFLFVYLLVSRIAKRRSKKTGPTKQEAAVEAWARDEISRMLATRLEVEESELATTLGGNPDPDLVTRLEKTVSGVEVVYERAVGSTQQADVRVEIRLDSGDLERSLKRIPWADLPEGVKDEFAKTGTAHVYRPWMFPWQR